MREDPYRILGFDRRVRMQEVEAAYRRLQRRYHPDSKTGDREQYDRVTAAYNEIRKNPSMMYVPVAQFESSYKNSEEELKDITELYTLHRGKMSRVIDGLVLSSDEDEGRLREIIDRLIAEEKVQPYRAYEKLVRDDLKRRAKRTREEQQAEKLAEKMGIDLSGSLEDVLNRRARRDAEFLERLEAKYPRKIKKQ
jgi:DnaJ homolog subfamily C member 9